MDDIVLKLVKHHKTRNPVEIAKNLGITIVYEDLGNINGFYNTYYRLKFIHVNLNKPDYTQKFIIAHELGHALLHPNSNTPFLRNNTHLSIEKFEIEANKFAIFLLISDEELIENSYLTTGQLSILFGYHQKLIELRLHNFKPKAN